MDKTFHYSCGIFYTKFILSILRRMVYLYELQNSIPSARHFTAITMRTYDKGMVLPGVVHKIINCVPVINTTCR